MRLHADEVEAGGWRGATPAEELPLLRREQPWAKATVVAAGSTLLDHDPQTEIVVAPPRAR